jgi:hypothetical protein
MSNCCQGEPLMLDFYPSSYKTFPLEGSFFCKAQRTSPENLNTCWTKASTHASYGYEGPLVIYFQHACMCSEPERGMPHHSLLSISID